MTTFVSIIIGTAITGVLFSWHNQSGVALAFYAIAIAIVGSIAVLYIPKVKASGTNGSFPWNPAAALVRDLAFLKRQKSLFLAAMANSYFWMIGLIFQTNILIYGRNMLGNAESSSILLSLMPAFIGIGIACGSMLANRWSGKKVELGLVPLGGLGLALFRHNLVVYHRQLHLDSSYIVICRNLRWPLLCAALCFFCKRILPKVKRDGFWPVPEL